MSIFMHYALELLILVLQYYENRVLFAKFEFLSLVTKYRLLEYFLMMKMGLYHNYSFVMSGVNNFESIDIPIIFFSRLPTFNAKGKRSTCIIFSKLSYILLL